MWEGEEADPGWVGLVGSVRDGKERIKVMGEQESGCSMWREERVEQSIFRHGDEVS